MKTTIFSVNIARRNTESTSIFTTDNEDAARNFFDSQTNAAGEKVDTSGWADEDQAWPNVYAIELIKLTIDEYGDPEELETLGTSGYYNME